jgi:hypothetical protein
MRTLFACLFILLSIGLTANAQDSSPVYITLWLDTEDYILPQSDDAAKRVAELLTRLNVKATFKVVGEKARTLDRRGRMDVIAALNMLNVFNMGANQIRMELSGGNSLAQGKAEFQAAYSRLRTQGGGLLSIYLNRERMLHP